jgi:hypothetical protein
MMFKRAKRAWRTIRGADGWELVITVDAEEATRAIAGLKTEVQKLSAALDRLDTGLLESVVSLKREEE